MPKLKIRVNYMMKNSMYEFVKEVAENMELSASELLRRILDEWRVDLEEDNVSHLEPEALKYHRALARQ